MIPNELLGRVPTLRPGCRVVVDGSGTVSLMIPEAMLKMTVTGGKILRLVDGKRTVAEIIDALSLEFTSANRGDLENDTVRFLKQLETRTVLLL